MSCPEKFLKAVGGFVVLLCRYLGIWEFWEGLGLLHARVEQPRWAERAQWSSGSSWLRASDFCLSLLIPCSHLSSTLLVSSVAPLCLCLSLGEMPGPILSIFSFQTLPDNVFFHDALRIKSLLVAGRLLTSQHIR